MSTTIRISTGNLLPVLLAGLLMLLPQSAALQTQPIAVTQSVEYSFGGAITFRAAITAPAPIAAASLFYRTAGTSDTVVLAAAVAPGEPSVATAVQDLRAHPMAPFATFEYWWKIDLADGQSTTTVPGTFTYEDNRFPWQSLRAYPITVSWVAGDTAFGQTTLDTASRALAQLQRDLASPPPSALRIYVYPDRADLRSGLRLSGRTWSGAYTDPSAGVVVLAFDPNSQSSSELERVLPHELAHITLAQRLGEAYASLPTWLGEGIATLQEPVPDPAQRLALEQAADSNDLLPLDTLCTSFPVDGEQALLAYAQSASLVQYLRDVYGSGSIAALLDAHAEGASCTGALERVYRRTPEQLFEEWRRSALSTQTVTGAASNAVAWSLLLLPVVILLATGTMLRRLARRAPAGRDRT